jgi:hypothetical protein
VLGEARGAFVLLAAFALGAVRCQAVLGVDAYDFEPASEDAHPLAKAPDAGAGLDAGPALDGFEPEDGGGASPGALAGDAAAAPDGPVVLPCEGPGCAPPACDGCVVGERCVPAGQALPFSPCLVCDPAQSASGYSIGVGNACGEQASACSAPDTCDAEGFCAPNDLPAGTPCGDATGPACDAADTCDGAGACVDRRAGDGTPCEDGLFCTTGDQCLAGACASGGPLPCGDNQQCAEDADACVCSGCVVDGACLPACGRPQRLVLRLRSSAQHERVQPRRRRRVWKPRRRVLRRPHLQLERRLRQPSPRRWRGLRQPVRQRLQRARQLRRQRVLQPERRRRR